MKKLQEKKEARRLPRGVYLFFSVLVSAEAFSSIKQTWLKYKWGDLLQIQLSETIGTGILAALFTALALVSWYLWFTYYRQK